MLELVCYFVCKSSSWKYSFIQTYYILHEVLGKGGSHRERDVNDTFLSKTPIAPCYCQMMGRTLKEEIRITQYNNQPKPGKYSLEDLFRASDNIPHHYPKF